MMIRLLIKNGLVCNSQKPPSVQDIYIEGGVIQEVGPNLNIDIIETIDVKDSLVLPGLIDMNCDICDPGFETKEDIMSVSKSAAKGGFTSITCLPNTIPVIDNKTVVNYIINKSEHLSKVNIFPYGSMTTACEGVHIAEIGEMKKAGIVAISDGNISISDTDLMRNILLYSNMFKIPVITACEDKNIAYKGVMNQGKFSTEIGLEGIPREAEETIVARNLILAQYTNAKLHITHVSTKGSVDLIRMYKKLGVDVTCDTCPHYFTLSEGLVASYNTLAKVKPPLRTKSDVEAIIEGIIDGTIDVISTGHSPTTLESKRLEFNNATYGITSLETAFSLSYTSLVDTKLLSIQQLVHKMSSKPAEVLNLEKKGKIKIGYDADIIIVDKNGEYTINPDEFASKAKFSPYAGLKTKGEILYTIIDGNFIYLK